MKVAWEALGDLSRIVVSDQQGLCFSQPAADLVCLSSLSSLEEFGWPLPLTFHKSQARDEHTGRDNSDYILCLD